MCFESILLNADKANQVYDFLGILFDLCEKQILSKLDGKKKNEKYEINRNFYSLKLFSYVGVTIYFYNFEHTVYFKVETVFALEFDYCNVKQKEITDL